MEHFDWWKYSGYLVNKPLQAAGMSEDNALGG